MNTRVFWSVIALGLLASPLLAHDPYLTGGYAGYGYSGCATCNGGYGWGVPGCCDRPVSKNDHLWDNYCQEKWRPTVCHTYLQPYWREGPMCGQSYGQGYPAPVLGHPEPIEATQVSTGGVSVTRERRQGTSQPTPAQPRRLPPTEVKPPMPPAPPEAPKTNELELRLLPTTRKPK